MATINRAILEAQMQLYSKGKDQALSSLERANLEVERCKASINVFNGAIESCKLFLSLLGDLEKAEQEKITETEDKQ